MSSTESDVQRKKSVTRTQTKKQSRTNEGDSTVEEVEGTGDGTTESTTITNKEPTSVPSEEELAKIADLAKTTEPLKNTNLALPNPESTSNTEAVTKKNLPKNYTIPKIVVKKTINLGSDDSAEDEEKSIASFDCSDLIMDKPNQGPDWYESAKQAQHKPNLKPSGSVMFKRGNGSNSTLLALTPFWREHLKALDYHIPLTIFNNEWILKDNSVSMNTSAKKKFGPTGLPAKSEWYLDSYEWIKAGDLMIEYLKSQFYDHALFAEALQEHFSFVKKLDNQHCWLTAFRYDMAVRQIVVGHHVDGCPQDPSLDRPEQVEIAKNQTETLRDGFEMRHGNPYAKGQKWEKRSPITGKWYVGDQSHDNPEADEDTDVENNSKGKKRANKWKNKDRNHDYHAKDDNRDNHEHFRGGRGNRGGSFRGRRSRSPYQNDRDLSSTDKGKGPSASGNKDKE